MEKEEEEEGGGRGERGRDAIKCRIQYKGHWSCDQAKQLSLTDGRTESQSDGQTDD